MASNKTPSLNLDIWAEMDFFKRAELNNNFEKIATEFTDRGVNVKWFGAKGDGIVDDTASIQAAINFVNALSWKPVIVFPAGNYRITSPLQMYSGIHLSGADVKSSEFQQNVQIKTTTSASSTFLFPSGDLNNVVIANIEFYAHTGASLFDVQNTGSGKVLKYSAIFNCGFNFYDYAYYGRWLGVHYYENYINNGNTALYVSGSDNVVRDNLVGVNSALPSTAVTIYLNSFSLSRFERNFITGWKSKCLVMDNCYKNSILDNWFDISDTCGIYATNSYDNMVIGNSFNKLCAVPYAQYIGQITLYDCYRFTIMGNCFSDQINNTTGKTISLRKASTGCSDIIFTGNTYANFSINAPTGESNRVTLDNLVTISGTQIPTWGSYKAGDIVRNSSPAAGGYMGWVCVTSGVSNTSSWVASTAYTVGQQVNANNKVYECTVAGTSGTSSPSHTTGTAIDGTVTWKYVSGLAVFKTYGAISS
ncbi:hypothetical protein CN533_27245 [Priestia megaterium]|uniref:glycosyl hydrolase family 28-related protein n=1 Tax=Priestia megaterium TaxID=1404 RepID=UPI000BFA0A05|nr:glycosyl hydrolase family 28-related protein [Priestia megaterium]PET68287.1 hypothetical protein CN533_27245 [Priestia megaterium]PFK82640.1 hypothetical protein COJ19_25790 [Priestia megaterium]